MPSNFYILLSSPLSSYLLLYQFHYHYFTSYFSIPVTLFIECTESGVCLIFMFYEWEWADFGVGHTPIFGQKCVIYMPEIYLFIPSNFNYFHMKLSTQANAPSPLPLPFLNQQLPTARFKTSIQVSQTEQQAVGNCQLCLSTLQFLCGWHELLIEKSIILTKYLRMLYVSFSISLFKVLIHFQWSQCSNFCITKLFLEQ
jgi:hypothetical protein